jgi:HK97 family phage major capsid protein
MQLIEQSPLDIDSVVLQDLAAAYGVQVDTWVLSGTGSGQPTGMLNLSGISTLTYTDATPTLMGPGKLYAQMAKAIGLIQTNRFMPPTHIIMHPLRWDWIMSTVDAQNRAVVLPHALPMLNPSGDQTSLEGQGVVGTMLGLPVLVDASIPTNLGSGTNQDAVIVAKTDDLWLWEGTVRAEAFEQTYANQLSLFLRLYNYLSFQPARYPKSISVITGTGLTTPAF